MPQIAAADAPGWDVAAQRRQACCTANISRLDVPHFRLHFHTVIAGHGYFELHPELRARRREMRQLRRGAFDGLDSPRVGLGSERTMDQKMRFCWGPYI